MTRRVWVIAAALFLVIVVLVAATALILRTNNHSDLTLNEAKQEVLKQYEGTIVSAELNDGSYLVRLQSETGLYELNVDKDHSGITAIKSIERYELGAPVGTASPDTGSDPSKDSDSAEVPPTDTGKNPLPSSSGSPDKESTLNPAVLLTEDEAAKLALGKVDGTVTDVDIEKVQGKWYYFVEIDTPDGREADVQLNAASGAIISVTWDDDDDDDNKGK
jgi:uncharacterized membrane protein YkoI